MCIFIVVSDYYNNLICGSLVALCINPGNLGMQMTVSLLLFIKFGSHFSKLKYFKLLVVKFEIFRANIDNYMKYSKIDFVPRTSVILRYFVNYGLLFYRFTQKSNIKFKGNEILFMFSSQKLLVSEE